MATLADSLVSSIDTNYGGGGGGGSKPANIVNLNDYVIRVFDRLQEWVIVWIPSPAKRIPFNENYVDEIHELRVRILTPTSDDRVKQISDEVISQIEANTLTGINYQVVEAVNDLTDRNLPVFAQELVCKFFRILVNAEINYGASSSSHTHDDRYYTEAEVDAMVAKYAFKTITGITNDVVADAIEDTLTLASANAALTIVGTTATDTITFTVDETQIEHDNLSGFVAGEHLPSIDEDNMASDSAAHVPTQQSVKAYVDAVILTEDTIAEMNDVLLAGPADDDILVYDIGTSKWRDYSPAEYADLIEGSIEHDNLSGFVADEHYQALDEDNMVSDSAVKVATQQSIKAYVDSAVGAGGHTHDTDTLQLDAVNSDGGAFSFTTTGAVTFNQNVNTQALDVTGNITVSGNVDGVDIAGHAANGDAHHNESHTHDGDTLQADGINSNGGAFAFNTTGALTIFSSSDINLQPTDDSGQYFNFETPANIATMNSVGAGMIINVPSSQELILSVADVEVAGFDGSGMILGNANARVTTILDEDAMGSDSDTALATQQSIKAYVDAAGGGETLAQTLAIGNTSGANDIVMADNQSIDFGTDNDCVVEHTGANMTLTNSTGQVQFSSPNGAFTFNRGISMYSLEAGKTDWRLTVNTDDADNMYIYNWDEGESQAGGNICIGGVAAANYVKFDTTGNTYWLDGKKLYLGTGSDCQVYHDGSHMRYDNDTGDTYIYTTGVMQFLTNGATLALQLDSAQVATFDTNGVTITNNAIGNAYYCRSTNTNCIHGSTGSYTFTLYANQNVAICYNYSRWYVDIDPHDSKIHDMGDSTTYVWDECYADNWNNVSSWKTYEDPISILKGFGPKAEDEYELEHSAIDDWIRPRQKMYQYPDDYPDEAKRGTWTTNKRDEVFIPDLDEKGNEIFNDGRRQEQIFTPKQWHPSGGYYKLKTPKMAMKGDRVGQTVEMGNYADGFTDEDFEHEEAWSINKALLVAIQAITKLDERVKELEARL